MKHKRFLSMLIVLAMCVGFLPTTAFADFNIYDLTISEGNILEVDVNINLTGTLTNYGTIIEKVSVKMAGPGTFYNYGIYQISEIDGPSVYDLTLSSIALSSGTLSPDFTAITREYAVTVDNSVTSIDITPTLNTGTGVKSMTVNGKTATSGAASTVSLSVGENSIPIVITASDGSDTTNTYTLTVTRQAVSCSHSSYTNGFCDDCGAYESAVQNTDGVYEISNAGQLFWFASLVNGDTTQEGITAAVADANAVLTDDIDLESKAWTPIGDFAGSSGLYYGGTFDGKGYTISNLYINNSASNDQGLFGYVSNGTVQNVTVSGNVTGYRYVGGVVGLNNGTVTNCYNSSSITGTVTLGGVVGYSDGSVINCCNSGSVTGNATDGYDYVGGVVGDSNGTVTDCINSGAVSGYRCVGGVVGINGGTVKSCYNSGTVNCTSQTAGGVVGYNYSGASTTNCYYLSTTASAAYRTNNGTLTNVESKTSTQFASGEVTWLLTSGTTDGTQAWYQTLGTDSYPILDSTHGTVYYTSAICDGSSASYSTYSNSSAIHVGYDANGFCTGCGGYQPATLNSDGIYEISNGGQLFWFASLVNGDSSQEGISAANTSANAILTANIDLSVTTSAHTSTEWTPIGDYGSSTELYYSGTFDGKNYTVSGLCINGTNNRQGLFGYVNGGTVQNVAISGSVTATGNQAGIAVGYNSGTVRNVAIDGTVTGTGSSYVGGAVGINIGTVQEVSASGTVTSDDSRIGGVVGFNNGGSVESCYSSATVSSSYMNVGGVVGYNNGIVTNCYNSGEVSGKYVGGVVGWNNSGSVSNCYSSGNVSGSSNVGGVAGLNSGSAGGTVTNCCYLEGTASEAVGSASGTITNVEVKTTTQFASGEVTWLLTGGTTNGTQAWYQNIDNGNTADSFPVLDSTHGTVYYSSSECAVSASSLLYSNSNSFTVSHAEFDEYGFCTICGGYQPAEQNSEGVYEISNAGQMYWFASLVNGDTTQEGITAANTSAIAVLTANIDLSVTTSTHTSTEWTPIGTKSAPYKGTFDGNGKTISGLSITTAADTTEAVYVGLFGYINAGTVKDLTVSGEIDVSGSTIYAGGIVGTVHNTVLSNLTSNVDVTAEATVKGTFGGVAASVEGTGDGSAHSTMECCVNYGTVTASGVLDCVGGLTGFMNSATITNCENRGKVDTSGGTAANAGGIYTGGIIAYINNANAVVTNCVNVGEISSVDSSSIVSYTGAIVGRINQNVSEVSNCYYLSSDSSTLVGVGGNGNSSATVETTAQTTADFTTGAAAWSLQDANTDYVWGQDLTSDDYPVLTSDTTKQVVKVTFYKSTTGIVLMESYTNADGTLSSYLTGSDYTFYSDYDLTNEISDIGSRVFDTDTDIYVVTDHDLTILETNGGTILEGTNYTYDDNLLTVLTGGTYTISGTSSTDTIKVTASDDVAITLYGVNITSDSKPPMEIDGTGMVTVKLSDENVLESTGEYYAGLQKTSTANELIITSADGDGEITGKLTATGGTNAAGIGGGWYIDVTTGDMYGGDGSNITISGGTVNATGNYGAGIGGGSSGGGTVTITGGTVNATGRPGAGIGGGRYGGGTVTITGGTVTAYSGEGAGIGGGASSNGTVTISGGYITAESAYSNAITTTNATITGGYFAGDYDTTTTETGYGTGTVYGCNVASSYSVYANVEDTKGDYPARVLPTAWTVAVTYATGGANGTAPSDDTDYGYGEKVTVDATLPLKKDGYAQTGWSLSSTDTTAVTTFNISGDTTLYPVFARQFTDSGASDISLTYGEAITAIDLSDYIEFVDDTTFTSTSGEFTFALADGYELPAGLTLSEGIITGTPTAAAEAQSVSFTVTDKTPYIMLASLDSNPATVSATLTLTFTVAKAASSVSTAPTAATGLTYNGSEQELVSAGTATGGEMQYSMSESGTYSADIPTATNAGTYTVYYKAVGDSNHSDTSAESVSVTIAKADSSVTTAPAANTLTYNGSAQELVTAGTADGGEMQYSMSENGTYSAEIPTATNAGDYIVYYKVVGDDNHSDTAVASIGVTIGKATPVYTVPTGLAAVYGDTLASVTLPTGWTWANTTTSVGNVGTNEFAAIFTPSDTANYNTVTENVTVTVEKADQAAPDNLSVTQPDEQTSTGTITGVTTAMEYSTNGGISWTAITGDTLTLSPCTVLIRYAASNNYNAGATVEITISASNPSYTIPTDLTAVYGDTLSDVTLPTATNGTWTWADEDLSVGNAGANTFTAIFTPSDGNHNTVYVDVTVTVAKAMPTYTVPTGLTAVYGDTLASVTLPTGWTWDDDTLSVGNVGDNEFAATFTPSDKTNYETVTENVTVTVNKATPTYTVPTGLTAVYGDTLASVTLPDGWTWNDDTLSVGSAGDNEFAATFTPNDKTNYETVKENVTVTVEKADQAAPDNLTVTQPDEQTSTGTITGVTTAMEYSTNGGSSWTAVAGDTLVLDPCTVLIRYAASDNYNAGATVEITISASNPSYTIPTDLTAVYGDTLASVTLPTATNGTWTWEDEDLSVGNAGTNTFTAIFTPNDGNHNTVYVDVTVTVAKAMPSYTVPTGLTAVYGDTLASVTLPTGWRWDDDTLSVGNVGDNEFAATFTPDDKTNYETVTADLIVTVAPLPIEVEWDYTSFVYDGSEKTVSAKVTNAIGDDEVNLICIDNSATEVGSYEAAIMAVDNDNYTLTGGTGLTNEWTIEQSAADGSVKTYNGETQTNAFTYGDTITVKAKFNATGTAASGFTLSSLALGTAAVFNGDVQISDAVTVTEGDEITLTVDSTDLGAGNYTLTLKYCGDYNIAATALDFDITIAKAEPTVTAPTGLTAVYGDTLASVTLPDNWTWDDDTLSVGNAGENTFAATYTPADVDNYNTVTAELTVTVAKAEQSAPSGLTVTQPAEQGLTGTIAGVTTDMEYSTDGSTWTAVTGDPLTVDEGTVYIRYAESGNYNAGEAVEIVIASTVPTYEVPTGLTAVYGDTLKDVALPDADNGVWTWEDDELSVGSVGDNKFAAIFTPTNSKYNTVTVEVTVTVEKAEPSYEVPTGLTAVYGDKLSDVTLPNGWAWDNENLSVGEVGENEFAATYTPGDDNYNTVTANISVTVTKAEPTYEVPTGLTAVYGDKLSDVTLPDGWTWEDESLSVGNAGTNTFTAIFTPGDDNYNTVSVEVSVTVEKAEPSYEVPTGLTAVYGDTLASVALPDNWTWADATASVGGVGDNTFAAIYTPEDIANYNTATEILTVTVEKAEQGAPSGFTVTQPDEETSTGTITGLTTDMEYSLDGGDTWEEITDDTLTLDPGTVLIRYAETDNYNAGAAVEIEISAANPSYTTPTDLTAVYGDTLADVTLPDAENGTWTWENESLNVGNAGTNTFTAIFTPNDDNHNTVTVEVTVTVEKAEPSYEVPTGLTAVYGDILATVTLPTGWTWADAAQSVGNVGTNTFTAIFTPEDSVNYETVAAEIDVEVGKATPTYELPTGLTANYGDTLADVALPDGWTWANDKQSVGDVETNTFTAVFTPNDTENYNTITTEITVTVSAVTLTVTEAPTAARVKRGNTLSKSTLSGGSVTLADGTEISGTWAWADDTETMSKSGTYERTAVFTADDEAYGTVETAVTVTVYTSGGGGGGSSSGTTTYTVTAEEIENGDISFDNSTAKEGATVTITVTPDEGFETESITVTDASGNEIELTQTGDDTYTFVMPSSEVSISAEFTEIETETELTDESTDDDSHDCLSEKFTDVDTALWYHEYIDYVLENGLMNGTGGTTFEPNTATTRAMIVTILYRLEGEPKVTGTAAFTDVADGSWYADAVAWAAENGIVLGYGDGTFGANDVITREQTAAILYRYAGYKGTDISIGEDTNILSYTDADEISEYAIPAMQWAVGTGLVNGKGNNTLDPQGGATRAETAAMLMRFIEVE